MVDRQSFAEGSERPEQASSQGSPGTRRPCVHAAGMRYEAVRYRPRTERLHSDVERCTATEIRETPLLDRNRQAAVR